MNACAYPPAVHRTSARRRSRLAIAAPAAAAVIAVAVLGVGGGLVEPSVATAAGTPPQVAAELYTQLHADAMQAFHDRRYAAAYGRFARLADAGHAPSAHIALVMLRHGRAMFDSDWYASPSQQARWNAAVVNAGRDRIEIVGDDGSE
jgi:hypothetical protein